MTQKTVTLMEPASVSSGFFSCLDVGEHCQQSQQASFGLGFNGEFIATLTSNPLAGGYFVTSEVYGASEESRVRGTWSRKENAARTAPRYLCVAHSWKVFSGMLLRMPRSGVAASAATVAYPLTRWS